MPTDDPTPLIAELDQIEAAIVGMPIEIRRLTTSVGDVGLRVAEFGTVHVTAGQFGFPIATDGDLAGDTAVLALQLEEGSGSWDGHEFAPDRIWFYGPGSEHSGVGLEGPDGRPPRFATISVPADAVEGFRSGETDTCVRMFTDARVSDLRAELSALLANADEVTGARAQHVGRDLLETVVTLTGGLEETRFDHSSAAWITREAIELSEVLGPMPSTIDLAAAIGVSDRWVRAAFQRVYGVSAAAFFKSRAIDGAHRELGAARPESTSVTEVAMRWGFWHLGRFSATYRSYFGELPSETLHRLP